MKMRTMLAVGVVWLAVLGSGLAQTNDQSQGEVADFRRLLSTGSNGEIGDAMLAFFKTNNSGIMYRNILPLADVSSSFLAEYFFLFRCATPSDDGNHWVEVRLDRKSWTINRVQIAGDAQMPFVVDRLRQIEFPIDEWELLARLQLPVDYCEGEEETIPDGEYFWTAFCDSHPTFEFRLKMRINEPQISPANLPIYDMKILKKTYSPTAERVAVTGRAKAIATAGGQMNPSKANATLTVMNMTNGSQEVYYVSGWAGVALAKHGDGKKVMVTGTLSESNGTKTITGSGRNVGF